MLSKIQLADIKCNPAHRFTIVASLYNKRYVDGMLKGALHVLKNSGAKNIQIIRVPGAFEIPCVTKKLVSNPLCPPNAIICLGVIIRGETAHAQLIGEAVTQALMQIQITHAIPVIHEVLLLENKQQAQVRCMDPEHNRGIEAAQTAIQMAMVMEMLDKTLNHKR